MKTITLILCILTASMNFVLGQTNIKKQVDSLKYLQGNPLALNAITWKIVAKKRNAIQPLIDKLDDATITNAIYKCKKQNWQSEILPL